MGQPLRKILKSLEHLKFENLLWKKQVWEGPSQSDISSWQAQGYSVYQGKIRTVLSRDGLIQMLHSDRLTAFDRFIGYVPLKGVILTSISKYWFESLRDIVPTHFKSSFGPRALIVEDLRPVKAEVVVRGYLAGSLLRAYSKGERVFCGQKLPEGLAPHQRLPEPIITPTTKAKAFEHDEDTSSEELIKNHVCTRTEWEQISEMAHKVFSHGTRILSKFDLILADTKYEFGRNLSGEIKLIDEVHTPDSSRMWAASSYEKNIANNIPPEMFDKENIRQWLLKQGFSGHGEVPTVPEPLLIELAETYLGIAEKLTGKTLDES